MIDNKKIVLTGANSGIGLETLKLLMQGNNKILAVDLKTDVLDTLDNNKVIPFVCDVSKKENIDAIFDKATEVMGDIDIFFANAGFPYFEKMDYVNWDRMDLIFKVNTYSPIYTYMKFVEYKNGKAGQIAITISAMGKMGMPGYALYSGTKFALQGWQESLRLEMPSNISLTTVYPVATDTGFFKKGTEGNGTVNLKKPFPVQKPTVVARKIYKGLDKKKKYVNPCPAFGLSRILFGLCPPLKKFYWHMENKKFQDYLKQKEANQK
ncbi:MAG: SDR family NAD(P)-dependent oxidoreductase [Clostridia bacterium]|nr:SDR family NAD(P)-dependent oxidoreductase [Clostridia bacterium]